jgi:hypothetical protein
MKQFSAQLIFNPDDPDLPIKVRSDQPTEIGSSPLITTHKGIRVDHPQVAEHHAELKFSQQDNKPLWQIRDLGSEHGTFVNERQLARDWHNLAPGDRIKLGSNDVQFTLLFKEEPLPKFSLPLSLVVGSFTLAIGLIGVLISAVAIPAWIARQHQALEALYTAQNYQTCYEKAEALNPRNFQKLQAIQAEYGGKCRLALAQQQADQENYGAAVSLLKAIDANSPVYATAQTQLATSSEALLQQALAAYDTQGDLSPLTQALTILSAASPWQTQAQTQLEQLTKIADQLKEAEAAIAAHHWQEARSIAQALQGQRQGSAYLKQQVDLILSQSDQGTRLDQAYEAKDFKACFTLAEQLGNAPESQTLKQEYSQKCRLALAEIEATQNKNLAAAIEVTKPFYQEAATQAKIEAWSSQLVAEAEKTYRNEGKLEPLELAVKAIPEASSSYKQAKDKFEDFKKLDEVNRPIVNKAQSFLNQYNCSAAKEQANKLQQTADFKFWQDEKKRILGASCTKSFTSSSSSALSNSNTSYSDPSYSDPGYSDPGYSDPGYSDPGYSTPVTPESPPPSCRELGLC